MKRPHFPTGRTRQVLTIGVVGVVAVVGALAFTGRADASYRTAQAALGNVEQDLHVTGTVTLSGRSDLQFGTGGTVTMALPVGSKVKKGDAIAQVDTTTLTRSVTIAQASVASALAKLSSDQDAKDNPPATQSEQTSQLAGGGSQAVDRALKAAEKACASTGAPTGTPTQTASGSPSATPTTTGTASATVSSAAPRTAPTGGAAPGGLSGGSCAQALQSVRQAVQGALASNGNGGGNGSGASSGRTPTQTVTDADIARDEASIASARTQLVQAQQNLDGATITAPADGTVAQTDVKVGAQASTGSTAITVIGAGLTTVSIGATTTQISHLKVGQSAMVTSTLGAKVASGSVTWIGTMPTSSASSTASGSSTTFPVVVTLTEKSATLAAGSPVDVSVQIGAVQGVVTVPTSAISNGTVTVVKDGKASRVRVTTGLVGAERTQITDGLDPGVTVVLADLKAEIPTSTVNQRGFGGGGLGVGGGRRTFGG